MSIDDGTNFTDIDSNYDALVVMVNGSNSEQTHSLFFINNKEICKCFLYNSSQI